MLSRTADHLFWMARYIERAENTARMLDVNLSTGLLPQSAEEAARGWRALPGISELLPAYDARHAFLSKRDVL
ncbi:MAG: alpha-E domain-containing protein, partial [Betaproteobacteria bacterium]